MIAKRTKQKLTFLVDVHLFGFFVQFSHNTKKEKEKRNSIVKNIFNMNKLNIRHSKQMCDLLEIPLHRVHIDVLWLPEIATTWKQNCNT